MIEDIRLKYDEYSCDFGLNQNEIEWLIEQAEKVKNLNFQLSELVCAVYEHVNEGTELMEIAEKIDRME